jgi:hypothetical protein
MLIILDVLSFLELLQQDAAAVFWLMLLFLLSGFKFLFFFMFRDRFWEFHRFFLE